MKKTILCAALCLMTLAAGAQTTLTILHTNDTHSTVMPLSRNLNDTMKADRGGMIRRLAMLDDERQKAPDLLLFDSGDFSQGSAYYSLFKGDVEVGLMNRMGYDAATLGNHEFDYGMENLVRLVSMAEFPIVCANYDFTGTQLEGLIKPYVVIERAGARIGVFGLAPTLAGLVSRQNYEGIEYLNPIETAQKMVDTLRSEEGCDIIVCLSHLGWDLGDDDDDNKLIAGTRGIDLVLGGHSHTYMKEAEYVNDADGKPVMVDQNGKHSIYVGKITIEMR